MKIYIDFLLICIAILPKINIIKISGNSTGIRIEDIIISIYLILEMISVIKKRKIKLESKDLITISKYFFIYIMIASISTMYGLIRGWVQPIISMLYLMRKIEYFCLIFVGYNYMKQIKDITKLKSKINFVVLFHFAFSILQLLGLVGSFNGGVEKETLTQGRVSSTFNGAYEFSAFLLLLLPIYLNEILNNKDDKKINYLMIIIILLDIYISQSRSSLIIALLIFILMFVKIKKISMEKFFIRFTVAILGIIIIFVAVNNQKIDLSRFDKINVSSIINIFEITWKSRSFEDYLKNNNWYGYSTYSLTTIENLGMDASMYVRISHWVQMIDGLCMSPILGLGVSISGTAADGNYIRILCESGILGIIAWFTLMWKIYKSLNTKQDMSRITRYAFISIAIGATLIDIFEASKVMMIFWFMLGVTYANNFLRDKNE